MNMKVVRQDLFGYVVIVLFAFSFYYFFTEGLPWFWYDDVYWVELAGKSTTVDILKKIFSVLSINSGYERPILELYMKFCSFFFGEDSHYYRIVKVMIFSLILCVMFYLVRVYGEGNKYITVLTLLVFATFPAVMIVNTWINESATLELLFKVCSFIVFFVLISDKKEESSSRNILLAVLLVFFVIFSDKSKVTAKIVPIIFLSFLFVTKNKKPLLYIASFVSLLCVIPYKRLISAISGSGVSQSKSIVDYNNVKLFYAFFSHIWPLLVFGFLVFFTIRKKELLKHKLFVFSCIWLTYEMFFFFFYPSDEMRYLFSSLAAAVILFSIVISFSISHMRKKTALVTTILVVILILYNLSVNFLWAYNFRGSFGGYFVLVDKKMKFINQNFKNSLCLYSNFTLLYYSRDTTNQYVNLNPNNSEGKRYYVIEPQGIKIVNPEKYESIIILDGMLFRMLLRNSNTPPTAIFDSIIQDSLYDSFQRMVNFKIHSASLYNISLREDADYPQYSGIYRLR